MDKNECEGTILQQDLDGNLIPRTQLNELSAQMTEETIWNYYDNPTHGHPGISKTVDLIQRAGISVTNLWKHVTNYVKKCLMCQRNKHRRHALYGEGQPNPIPNGPWEDISMDFIIKLPKSRDPVTEITYDAIMVIVDRFTKYLIVVPFKETHTAEQLEHLLLDRLVRDHGVPITIITDRDKLFMSNYWKTISAAMGTKPKMSMAYHPQMDGQTEQANQVLETYLWHYINHTHSNWVQLLPVAQLAINQHRLDSTKESPFFANFGRYANIGMPKRALPNAEKALQNDKLRRQIHASMKHYLEETSDKMQHQMNKKRKMASQLKKGDKVYLLTKNWKVKPPRTKKLDHVKVGPFLVEERTGPVNVRLRLPRDAQVHPNFHISMIEPADPETPLQETFHYQPEEEQEFEVERILKKQGQQYLVKWKDYPDSENTWEPLKNLANCQLLLQQY